MKLITYFLAFIGCIMVVSALPSPIRLSQDQQALVSSKSLTNTSLHVMEETFVRDDDPLFARYFDDVYEISEREFAEATTEPPIVKRNMLVSVGKAVVEGIVKIVQWIKAKIEADKQMRGQWTNDMVKKFKQKYPHFNFVVCHVKHKTNFKGVRGKDWGHSHQELKVSFGKTVGYEIYWFKEGTFKRIGDGGWLNWAYIGSVKSKSQKNSFITFGKP